MEENIIDIDILVKNKINKEETECKKKYKDVLECIQSINIENIEKKEVSDYLNTLKKEIGAIQCKLEKINKDESINLYFSESLEIIENCKKIVNVPMKIDFIGSKKIQDENIDSNKEYDNYIFNSIYIQNINQPITTLKKKEKLKDNIKCFNCKSVNNFSVENGEFYICNQCFTQKQMINMISYNDGNRLNPHSKYIYDRQLHFKNCINQYQGKQCVNIPDKVYEDLENQFNIHGLLVGTESMSRQIRFSNITKTQINIFLKELKYSKYYEDVYLIHSVMTLKSPDNISYIEDKLIYDFNLLSNIYDKLFKKTVKRKSFINTQYVFFQLLIKNKHKCDKEDFMILKTIDRKHFHDIICSKIFAELGWNFTPLF